MENLKHIFSHPKEKHTASFKKVFSYHPERVWGIILLVIFVLMMAFAAGSWFFFRMLSNDTIFDSDARRSGSELIQHSKLELVLSHYKAKAEKFKKLQLEKPAIVDPSL